LQNVEFEAKYDIVDFLLALAGWLVEVVVWVRHVLL
jgi:hypothetical protein